MKRNLIVLTIFIIFSSVSLHAQVHKRIDVRESFTDIFTVDSGAQFAAAFRESKLDGSVFHGGMKVDLIDPKSEFSRGISIGPTVELHRNGNAARKELTFMVGANAVALYGDPKDIGHRLLLTGEYKNNRVTHREGSQVTFRYALESGAIGLGEAAGSPQLGFSWQPVIGLEWENRARAAQGDQTGRIMRAYTGMKVVLLPGQAALDKRVEVSGSYEFWSDFFETSRIIDHDDKHDMIKASLTVYLDRTRHFGLSADYVHGEDPTKAVSYQAFGAFSVRVRF